MAVKPAMSGVAKMQLFVLNGDRGLRGPRGRQTEKRREEVRPSTPKDEKNLAGVSRRLRGQPSIFSTLSQEKPGGSVSLFGSAVR